eukprot:11171086-Lingulodinium_polyedra.AAC.1
MSAGYAVWTLLDAVKFMIHLRTFSPGYSAESGRTASLVTPNQPFSNGLPPMSTSSCRRRTLTRPLAKTSRPMRSRSPGRHLTCPGRGR